MVVVSDLNKTFGGSTDFAKKRHGSADLHTPIHPPHKMLKIKSHPPVVLHNFPLNNLSVHFVLIVLDEVVREKKRSGGSRQATPAPEGTPRKTGWYKLGLSRVKQRQSFFLLLLCCKLYTLFNVHGFAESV